MNRICKTFIVFGVVGAVAPAVAQQAGQAPAPKQGNPCLRTEGDCEAELGPFS